MSIIYIRPLDFKEQFRYLKLFINIAGGKDILKLDITQFCKTLWNTNVKKKTLNQ